MKNPTVGTLAFRFELNFFFVLCVEETRSAIIRCYRIICEVNIALGQVQV